MSTAGKFRDPPPDFTPHSAPIHLSKELNKNVSPFPCFWDIVFVIFIALYSFAAILGSLQISGLGVDIDSDLGTYASALIAKTLPNLFVNDPFLHTDAPANSIASLFKFLANLLTPDYNFAYGFLRAGAIIIFTGYLSAYLLGRYLYQSPGLATLFALVMGMTVWVGWGTFWGLTQSNPLPRTAFAAIWPLLILLMLHAVNRPILRIFTMFCAGLLMWVHGISALSTGAMLFFAFGFYKCRWHSLSTHLLSLLLCLIAFFIPVIIALRHSLFQGISLSSSDLAILQEMFNLRWQEDYGRAFTDILSYLKQYSLTPPIFSLGIVSFFLCLSTRNKRLKEMLLCCPGLLLGIVITVLICWLESTWSWSSGRISMGHELIRALRFLVPLSWILLVALVSQIWLDLPFILRAIAVCTVTLAIFSFSQDKQNVAVQYTISNTFGLHLPFTDLGNEWRNKALSHREALEAVKKYVAEGELVFSSDSDLAIRYVAQRPLAHNFKDGFQPFYNKDINACKEWLELEKLRQQSGYYAVWQKTKAKWMLTNQIADHKMLTSEANLIWENANWLLLQKK